MRHVAVAFSAFALMAAGNPSSETEHKVGNGETLNGIANRAQVPPAVIAAANGIVEPYEVKAGQILVIPRQRTHTVSRGETALGIALKYGVPFDLMAVANALKAPYSIRRGQKLIIPFYSDREIAPAPVRERPYFRKPHDGKALLGYGLRSGGGGHEGIDFAVSKGDMIRASASGKVVFADADSGRFGHIVVVDHGNGWRTRYGHLTRVTVKLGEFVKAGERIGIGGQGGMAQRPEVHFEIVHDGRPVDPLPLLEDKGG